MSPDGATVFVTGYGHGLASDVDYATVAYDAATGAELWVKGYNGPGNKSDWVVALGVSPDGGSVFVTGNSDGSSSSYDYATVAYDAATGAELWVKRYKGPGDDSDLASALGVSPDGASVFVTGSSYGSTSQEDYATVAHDAATGARLWVKSYNGPGNASDLANALGVSPDGARVFVTGGSDGAAGYPDYATVVYEA